MIREWIMKKRMILVGAFFLFALSAMAFAKHAWTVRANISKMKLYYNNDKLEDTVLTIDKTIYIPLDILSDSLGFDVSKDTKANKIVIKDGDYSGDYQGKLKELQDLIDDLNRKLRYYSDGFEDETNQTEGDFYASLYSETSMNKAVWPLQKNLFMNIQRYTKADTWFKVELQANEGLTVALRSMLTGDLNLYMYDQTGTLIRSAYNISKDQYGILSYKTSKQTMLYIRVEGQIGNYSLGFYDNYYNNQDSRNDERDFFGSLFTAKKLVSGYYSRDLENLKDCYRIDVKQGQTLTVNLIPQMEENSMNIILYDQNESVLSQANNIQYNKIGTVYKKAAQDSTYFVVVNGAVGKYNLIYSLN